MPGAVIDALAGAEGSEQIGGAFFYCGFGGFVERIRGETQLLVPGVREGRERVEEGSEGRVAEA